MSARQTAESFWARVDAQGPDDCWNWQRSTNSTGYGNVWWCGKNYVAHRVAAWLVGMVESLSAPNDSHDPAHVLHKCDNRRCCNPKHFFLGSFTDNMLDAYQKGRKVQPRGMHHTNAKLTNEQAVAIRHRYANAPGDQVGLAREYGVSQRVISLITRGETYKCC